MPVGASATRCAPGARAAAEPLPVKFPALPLPEPAWLVPFASSMAPAELCCAAASRARCCARLSICRSLQPHQVQHQILGDCGVAAIGPCSKGFWRSSEALACACVACSAGRAPGNALGSVCCRRRAALTAAKQSSTIASAEVMACPTVNLLPASAPRSRYCLRAPGDGQLPPGRLAAGPQYTFGTALLTPGCCLPQ